MTKILIAGDLHGNVRWLERLLRTAAKAGHDTIYLVGDVGLLWPAAIDQHRFTMLAKRWTAHYGFKSFVAIDGNHDNHKALRALPLNDEGFGVISDRVLYAPRGLRWTVGGRRFGALGGAFSVDREWRTWGKNLFEGEEITAADVDLLGAEPLDVLLTHEVPVSISVTSSLADPLSEETACLAREGRHLVEKAALATNPALVFSGHWHQLVTQQLLGSRTVVHVLDRDGFKGNCVELDLETLTVTEFPIKPF